MAAKKPAAKKPSPSTGREYFRGVVWPRGEPLVEPGKPPNYRYVIVGMLVTDKPLPELDKLTGQDILDGQVFGVGDLLSCVRQRPANLEPGDAVDVLTNLDIL